jgi:hypothetical protein
MDNKNNNKVVSNAGHDDKASKKPAEATNFSQGGQKKK